MSGIATSIPIPLSESDAPSGCDPIAHAWVLRVMSREGPGIIRMLWRLLGREADVLDAYQDCFCKLATIGGPKRLRNAKAYAYRTAGNIAIEMLRKRKRHLEHRPRVYAATHDVTDDAASDREPPIAPSSALRDAIARLPEHLRNVVTLRDLGRMSYDEVGRTLGITPATARVYRRHAIVKLAELLDCGGI
jgi:RNA polymerase sigma-70 factor (ECF subfamily)